MSEPFVGEIRMFAGNFAPRGWALCDGQWLAISQNDALFSLLGTIYGGDGQATFALPDLRGRLPIHAGTGPGLSPRQLGSKGGTENVTLVANQLPAHTHAMMGSADRADARNPRRRILGTSAEPFYAAPSAAPVSLHQSSIAASGGGQPHPNLMPYVCVNFIIALFGIYPSRN